MLLNERTFHVICCNEVLGNRPDHKVSKSMGTTFSWLKNSNEFETQARHWSDLFVHARSEMQKLHHETIHMFRSGPKAS